MRDIRGDLQDRANLLERQIVDAQDQFDKLVEQLSQEHDSRLADLKSELDAVSAVIESEDRRLGQAPSVVKAQPQLRPSNLPEQAHSHPRLTDTPIPKMRAVSAR
jgi:ABC-type transporter Mla subunit MlaD